MTISGFTMVRNAEKLYFPIKESILSVLPIVDEFIVALGDSDANDHTRKLIESIGSDKIRIYDRQWQEKDFVESRIFALETNFALQQCKGDWCFYIQADEVVHEQDLPTITAACKTYLPDARVDGLLFKYYHFFGDYDHYLPFHGWYKNEIRIIRNHAGVYSFRDAQSFRKGENQKLNVVEIDAHVYHYGWVRPPHLLQSKKMVHDSIHHGVSQAEQAYRLLPNEFDYGALGRIPRFKGTHPAVMADFIRKLNWQQKLNYARSGNPDRDLMKHEKRKYRLISFLENTFNGGRDFVGYTNWNLIQKA
jgi:hypothetical protein